MKVVALSFLLLSFIAAGSLSAANLPAGFVESQVAGGLAAPTAMQFAPDGRLFVAEEAGRLRVIKDGVLLSEPFVSLTVSSSGEHGLLGIAFDPAFVSNHFIYLYYTAPTPAVHNRISRFTASGDVAVAGSEVVIFELDDLSAGIHDGGALAFGPDGKLYAGVGENANWDNAQSLSNVLGKILRINADGTIPDDNPFVSTAIGRNGAIWALGLRNPFTFAFNPGSGPLMFLNDVGEDTWEEIDDGMAGANYGWPTTEGPTTDPSFVSPRYAYDHSEGACAISGGAFYAPLSLQFPSDYLNDYFFADFCGGWIHKLDPADGNAVVTFATGIRFPVDLKVGDDGALYYLARGNGARTGVVYRIDHQNVAPIITTQPSSHTVPAGTSATFTVRASGDAPLSYQWQRNGADIIGATSPDYTIDSVAAGDNGALFRAIVGNAAGSATSNEALLTVITAGTGNGLLAVYYDDIAFTGTSVTRIDPTIDFEWGDGSPSSSIAADTFSARWEGEVQPLFSEAYTFYTESDDGVRLSVNGQEIVNNWTDHPTTENSGAINLTAGQRYDIRLEFYENVGDAVARLLWSSSSTPKEVVPSARLYPEQLPPVSTPFHGVPVAIPGIVQAEEFDEGGEGIAYHDQTPANEGGQFRTADGVDIESTSDEGGGFNVGWLPAGEWLAYSVDVAGAGQYLLEARVAANGPGGTFHIEVAGSDISGPMTIPDTGAWQKWTTISTTISLNGGRQTLRFVADAYGPTDIFGNVNYLELTSASEVPNIVIYASDVPAATLQGVWSSVGGSGSPDSIKLTTPDDGVASIDNALESPADYFDVTFYAPAGIPYTLWLRLRATANIKFNDAVWVQFSDARDNGQAIYPIGSTSGLLVNLATDASATSLIDWGWVNGAYWLNQPARLMFATSGPHTIRIQIREDGVELDQIVLSQQTYASSPPGPVGNDSTIVTKAP